jgi:hypothetical protein
MGPNEQKFRFQWRYFVNITVKKKHGIFSVVQCNMMSAYFSSHREIKSISGG